MWHTLVTHILATEYIKQNKYSIKQKYVVKYKKKKKNYPLPLNTLTHVMVGSHANELEKQKNAFSLWKYKNNS